MAELDHRGIANPGLIPIIGLGLLSFLLLVTSGVLFVQLDKAKSEREDYAKQVMAENETQVKAKLQAEFDEKEKDPFKDFETDAVLGDIKFRYPKTWSVSMNQDAASDPQIDAYFNPNVIRTDAEDTRSYALRVQLVGDSYSEVVDDLSSDIEDGLITTKAVTFNGIEGIRVDGQLDEVDRGAKVILPLRDKTVMIWTESRDFLDDFEKVMTSFTFNP